MITLSSFYATAYPTFIISQCFKARMMNALLKELRNIIISVTDGDIPKPYDLLSLDAEQLKKAMKFVQPQAVTVEVTPEILEHLKLGARAPGGWSPSL